MAQTIAGQVPPALVEAGLPASSIPDFISVIPTGDFESVPGISQTIIAAGVRAYQWASSDAFSTVFLTSIAFTCLGLICCIWVPNIESRLTNEVAATLHKRNTEALVGEKAV